MILMLRALILVVVGIVVGAVIRPVQAQTESPIFKVGQRSDPDLRRRPFCRVQRRRDPRRIHQVRGQQDHVVQHQHDHRSHRSITDALPRSLRGLDEAIKRRRDISPVTRQRALAVAALPAFRYPHAGAISVACGLVADGKVIKVKN